MVQVVYSIQAKMADYSITKWWVLYSFHYLNWRTHWFESCRNDGQSHACWGNPVYCMEWCFV